MNSFFPLLVRSFFFFFFFFFPFYHGHLQLAGRVTSWPCTESESLVQVIIKVMIVFIGAVRDLFQSPRCAANCLQHVRSGSQGGIVYKSRVTSGAYQLQRVVNRLVQTDSSAIKFNRVEMEFILALL